MDITLLIKFYDDIGPYDTHLMATLQVIECQQGYYASKSRDDDAVVKEMWICVRHLEKKEIVSRP